MRLYAFTSLAEVVARAERIRRAQPAKVDPRAETVRILNSNRKAA